MAKHTSKTSFLEMRSVNWLLPFFSLLVEMLLKARGGTQCPSPTASTRFPGTLVLGMLPFRIQLPFCEEPKSPEGSPNELLAKS